MTASAPLRRLPLSRHPGFAPLVALWLAALVGGCTAVLSGQLALPHLAIASGTAWGGLAGWIAARLVAIAQRRRAKPRHAKPRHAKPADYVARLLVGIDTGRDGPSAQPVDAPEPEPRHGKAVLLLRQQAPGDLAMPRLVERFAVALTDRGHAATPPADLGFALYALRNELRHTALNRTDSRAVPMDFAGADNRAARE